MKTRPNLLIAGRSIEAITDLLEQLQSNDHKGAQIRHIVNGHADPLYGVADLPDLLILHINDLSGGELEALLERPVALRPPIVVISETDDAGAMRYAMKAGARDFLLRSELEDLVKSVNAICDEFTEQTTTDGALTAVINAKGGAGATFLACNLAHLVASVTEEPTALIGLDTQFPTLPSYLDLKVKHGLMQALESVSSLDSVALDAMMASHSSGLKLLAARPEDFQFSFHPPVDQINGLLELLLSNYRHVVVDVPRQLDELNAQVISQASRIVMVVQQSLPHVQDATRLQQLLRDQLGISYGNLLVVVNRHDKRGEIQLADFEKALPHAEIVTVPNQFREVSESINLGVPMYEHARHSAVTRALVTLQSRIFGTAGAADVVAASSKFSSILQNLPFRQFIGGK